MDRHAIRTQGHLFRVRVVHGVAQPFRAAGKELLHRARTPIAPAQPAHVGNQFLARRSQSVQRDLTVHLLEIIGADHHAGWQRADAPLPLFFGKDEIIGLRPFRKRGVHAMGIQLALDLQTNRYRDLVVRRRADRTGLANDLRHVRIHQRLRIRVPPFRGRTGKEPAGGFETVALHAGRHGVEESLDNGFRPRVLCGTGRIREYSPRTLLSGLHNLHRAAFRQSQHIRASCQHRQHASGQGQCHGDHPFAIHMICPHRHRPFPTLGSPVR